MKHPGVEPRVSAGDGLPALRSQASDEGDDEMKTQNDWHNEHRGYREVETLAGTCTWVADTDPPRTETPGHTGPSELGTIVQPPPHPVIETQRELHDDSVRKVKVEMFRVADELERVRTSTGLSGVSVALEKLERRI